MHKVWNHTGMQNWLIQCSCKKLKNAQIAVFKEGMNLKVGIEIENVKDFKSKNEKHIIKKCHTGIKEHGTKY